MYNNKGLTILTDLTNASWADDMYFKNNYIYVIEKNNNRVMKYSTTKALVGVIVARANDNYTNLRIPTAIFVDDNQNVLIADRSRYLLDPLQNHYRILVYGPLSNDANVYEGRQLIQGSGRCYGVSMDSELNIYTSEYDNHRVLKWLSPNYTEAVTIAGNGTDGYYTDNIHLLSYPEKIYIDPYTNDLYIAEFDGRHPQNAEQLLLFKRGSIKMWKHGSLIDVTYKKNYPMENVPDFVSVRTNCHRQMFLAEDSHSVVMYGHVNHTGLSGASVVFLNDVQSDYHFTVIEFDPNNGDLFAMNTALGTIQKFTIVGQVNTSIKSELFRS